MNTKYVKGILALMFVLSSLFAAVPVMAATGGTLSFDPDSVMGPPPALGDEFAVTLRIEGAVDIFSWKVSLDWDPALLSMVEDPAQPGKPKKTLGTFLPGSPIFVAGGLNQATGYLNELTATAVGGMASGSGSLATVYFKVEGFGTGTIVMLNTITATPPGTPVSHVVEGPCNVDIAPPPATAPVAGFTPADGEFILKGTSVTLDASSSSNGFDTLPSPGHVTLIDSYKWEIDYGNDGAAITTIIESDPLLDPMFLSTATLGPIGITLTVTAPDLSPPTAGSYVEESAPVKHVITIYEAATGPSLDVYTARGGEFPFPTSCAYGPQELVRIYGKVERNGAIVAGKDVMFEIKDNNGNLVAVRVARSDANGIAYTEFRMPTLLEGPDALFGDWSIVGTVDIAEETATDTVTFEFGYILEITDVDVTPFDVFRGNVVNVEVSVTSIACDDIAARASISLYDNAKVPVKVYTTWATYYDNTVTTWDTNMQVPVIAFTGPAMAYVNVFSELPENMGVPYCPEYAAAFNISVP